MNKKQITAIVLLGLGLSMFLYGYSLHVLPVYSENNDQGFATAESVLIKEVSIGGLERKPDGTLHKTYTGAPPKACPT
ncbi:MAG: hypothetical protein ABFR90_06895 [Planctomycetota bacterium]